MDSTVFTPGQAYTAISRGTSLENMVVKNFSQGCVIANRDVIGKRLVSSREQTSFSEDFVRAIPLDLLRMFRSAENPRILTNPFRFSLG